MTLMEVFNKELAEKWYRDSMDKYLAPSVLERAPCLCLLLTGKDRAITQILRLMEDNTIIRAGWGATSVRGYHRYYVIFRRTT